MKHNSTQIEDLKHIVETLRNFLHKGGQMEEIRAIFDNLDTYLEKVDNKEDTKAIITMLHQFVAKGGQIEELKELIDSMNEHLEEEIKQRTAIVTTATELSDTQQSEIHDQVQSFYGKTIDCEFLIDPQVLGGMRIKFYDHIMDMTIDNALETMVKTLKH